MAGIQVISTTTIQAPSYIDDDSVQKIELTPWDLIFLPIQMIQKGLLFHQPNAKDTSTQIHHLKNSLSSTLAFFPPLTGRLAIVEHPNDTVSASILCNNKGALFVHAVAENTRVADILEAIYVPRIVHSFFPLNGVKNYEGTSQPLLAVQITELVDGIFIGFAMNHVVADGSSLWHFVNSWAEISRGLDKITKLPALKRWFLDGIHPPIRVPFKQYSEDVNQQPPLERVFHFTKETIAQLKSKANGEINSNNKISSLQAVLTHLWQSVIRNQPLGPQDETRYSLMIGTRPRMCPPLTEKYFGNAGVVGTLTMKAGELLDRGLGKAALEMNKLISLQSEEKIRSNYEVWVRSPRLLMLGRVASSSALATGSSPRFNIYGNDFGWGKPVAVRSGAANKSSGNINVFAGVEEGSIDIEVCLPYEILEAMGKDREFMATYAISI